MEEETDTDLIRIVDRAEITLDLADLMDRAFCNGDVTPEARRSHLKMAIMGAISDSENYGYNKAR